MIDEKDAENNAEISVREWWIYLPHGSVTSEPNAKIKSDVEHMKEFAHTIEYAAFEKLKAQYEELLSYLPKVPTEPYEKSMAQECNKLRAAQTSAVDTIADMQYKLNGANAEVERLRDANELICRNVSAAGGIDKVQLMLERDTARAEVERLEGKRQQAAEEYMQFRDTYEKELQSAREELERFRERNKNQSKKLAEQKEAIHTAERLLKELVDVETRQYHWTTLEWSKFIDRAKRLLEQK